MTYTKDCPTCGKNCDIADFPMITKGDNRGRISRMCETCYGSQKQAEKKVKGELFVERSADRVVLKMSGELAKSYDAADWDKWAFAIAAQLELSPEVLGELLELRAMRKGRVG